jgi:hypothetical protein
MDIRPLSTILEELSAVMKTLADQHDPLIPLYLQFAMVNCELQRGVESQLLRTLEVLVLAAHRLGLTREPAFQQAPVYGEAVQVLQANGKSLPTDLPICSSKKGDTL